MRLENAQGKEAQQHVQEPWTSPAAATALDTQQSRAGMPCSAASPACVIPSGNELLHKVELSTGVKPCSPHSCPSPQCSPDL